MLVFGGVRTPFVLDATFRGADDIDSTVKLEFDQFPQAKAALEDLILSTDGLDDFTISFRHGDVMCGDIVKFDFVTVTDSQRPERSRTRTESIVTGVWSISWRKPAEPPKSVLDDVMREELRMRRAADLV